MLLKGDIEKWERGALLEKEQKKLKKDVKHIKHEDAPPGWLDRCSGDGYKKHRNEEGEWIYEDIDAPVDGIRPCARCGEFPGNDRGDDYCIADLGEVMNACCGHGDHEGYIQFDSGITIRGFFKVEHHDYGKEE